MVIKGGGPPPSTDPSEWPHRPAYFCAHPDVHTKDYEAGAPLPLGDFIEFETDLFVGKMICRMKPLPPTTSPPDDSSGHTRPADNSNKSEESSSSSSSSSHESHKEYFHGKKRHYQFVVQGHFRKSIPLSDIAMGDFYEKPFLGIPKGAIMRMYQRFMETISPGLIMDMTSDNPKILAAFGSAQTMRVDLIGEEPDLTQKSILNDLQDNTKLLFGEKPPKKGIETSSSKRRSYLSKPKNASKYSTNPEHVYTIELYDHTMCFGSYYQHAMGTKVDMTKTMNAQPLAFAIFHKHDQAVICKFPVWHERLLEEMKATGKEEEKQ
ncbi:unnamed protein product [Cylindrotheca closterium]|uniref:Domain of unknown function at the cortex 1 domain-containing protein n=1 Tax=Cylindrotheca closterium TaxID=2856 RepID=A0AAD2JLE2_9STRA|nr:unnamed protein product [Cylindrotheca closterium]